jgi:5-methylcytosine-specific restriction endonuclease McrA
MPYRPLRPCSKCRRHLTEGRFCAGCKREHYKDTDRRRGTSAQRGYGADWQAIRREVLDRDPCCVMCGRPGEKGDHVDHVVPKRRGGTDDLSNLARLCPTCHNSRKQSIERGAA